MGRLYKFFFLLFLAIFVVSWLYSFLLTWVTLGLFLTGTVGTSISLPFSYLAKTSFLQAIIYSLFLFLVILLLFRRSFRFKQRFTLKHIIRIGGLFFAFTTAIFIIYSFIFPQSFNLVTMLMLGVPYIFLPLSVWFPFIIAWSVLFAILASRIKKADPVDQ